MIPISEFYRKLPPKLCTTCGNPIEEQHESYLHQCERCMNLDQE